MNKTHTLKELADIGAKAANSILPMGVRMSVLLGAPPHHVEAREAFTKAILDAIGYKLPKDDEREAFHAWCGSGRLEKSDYDDLFVAWKAGRDALRKEACSDKCEDTNKEPAWIPWAGGECPLPDTVMRWEMRLRDDDTLITHAKPKNFFWRHEEMLSDIIAYRVWE